jgi:hypothetical protein
MRLLHCNLSDEAAPFLEEFYDDIPHYAILSHRWGKATEEVSFKDIESGADISKKEGYKKLQYLCQQALEDGFKYVWIDTCCIDKSSSAELSEAINSMYNWYMRSEVCYAYLNDVSCGVSADPLEITDASEDQYSSFRKSEWFTRGWTLQELIAPEDVRFYDQDWSFIGIKRDLAELVSEITGISAGVLMERYKPSSVAQRMSWAAGRKTTRVEDRAYSLMGIFGVNMPPLYGEGKRAFIRLQEEIMRQSFDHSLFAWQANVWEWGCGLLADSPDRFSNCGNIVSVSYDNYVALLNIRNGVPDYAETNFGTRIQLPVKRISESSLYRAYLACRRQGAPLNNRHQGHKYLIQICLRKETGDGVDTYSRWFFRTEEEEYDELHSRRCLAETIYVSRSLVGPFKQMPSHKLPVEFRVRTSLDQDFLSYYHRGKIRISTIELGVANIDIGLEEIEDSVVITEVRHFYEPGDGGSRRTNVWVVLGFHGGRIWTDIHDEHAGGLESPASTLQRLHAFYLKQHDTGWHNKSKSTEKEWLGKWPRLECSGPWLVVGSITVEEASWAVLWPRVTVEFYNIPLSP